MLSDYMVVHMSQTEVSDQEVLDPTGDFSQPKQEVSLAPRLGDLSGKHISLYSNNKQNSDHFLRGVGAALQERYPDVTVGDVVYKKHASNPGSRWGLIDEIAADADAVLVAYGDCGSCTSYTVYDAVAFEKRGIPTVSYSSQKFIRLGQFEAFHHGCAGLPLVEFEHPIAMLDESEVYERRVTADVVQETDTALTAPAEQVAREYASRFSEADIKERPQFDVCTL